MNKVYGVTFKSNGKIYNFVSSDTEFLSDDKVIVETEKGLQLGKIICESKEDANQSEMKQIIRKASEEDYKYFLETTKLANESLLKAREVVKELDIDMNILNASYTFDRHQLLFNFIASERVDFRELVKKLAAIFHTRIELRQIGVRDKAKEISGLGQCGRQLCCSSFLENIESVTINMAKNQDIALNPNKINGSCGRLLCCLTYEDEEYSRCKNCLPTIGSTVQCEYGTGVVTSLNVLEKKYTIKIANEIYEVKLDNCCREGK